MRMCAYLWASRWVCVEEGLLEAPVSQQLEVDWAQGLAVSAS